jgi:hypothetical protein
MGADYRTYHAPTKLGGVLITFSKQGYFEIVGAVVFLLLTNPNGYL